MSKLTVILMLPVSIVLAIDGYLSVERELALFNREMRRDARVFGRLLGDTVHELRTTSGPSRAKQLVRHANAEDTRLRLRWVTLDAEPHATEQPSVAGSSLDPVRSGRAVSVATSDNLYTYIPLDRSGGLDAIEIRDSLSPRHQYTRSTVRRSILVISLTIGLCAMFALGLGIWFVGRPVRALVARTRAIGQGELAGEVPLRTNDEFGTLAGEIDLMSQNLATARDALADEHAGRRRAEESLRHADRLATVGTLASGIAHELGTPLNVVIERAAMVERGEVVGEELADNGRIIREQAQRMTDIVRQLLNFARREPTKRAEHEATVSVRDAVDLILPYAVKRDVELRLTVLCQATPTVRTDPEQLRQAVSNLILNAVQASQPETTVEITVDTARATPPPAVGDSAGDYVLFSVRDRGPGVPAEHRGQIFEPFFTTKDVGEGTGLGLAIAYGIVRDHDGWIEVEAVEPTGSTFTVYLPEAQP